MKKILMALVLAIAVGGIANAERIGVLVDSVFYYDIGGLLSATSTVVKTEAQFITALSDSSQTITIGGSFAITADRTVASTKNLVINNGYSITTTGHTLTINGPFSASPSCFSGTGSVVFGGGKIDLYHPEWFGLSSVATGANNQIYLTAFTSSLPTGSVVQMPSGTFPVTGLWTIDRSLTIRGSGCTLNFATDAASQGVEVTSSGVTIDGLTVTGPNYATSVSTQIGIYAHGADSSHFISGIQIRNCILSAWSYSAISTQFATNFQIASNTITNGFNSGIYVFSSYAGDITDNQIVAIGANGSLGNAYYGIALTKHDGSEAVYPVPYDIRITNNKIENIPYWDAINTHGAHDVVISKNLIKNCLNGIDLAPYTGTAGSEKAPIRTTISDNVGFNDHGAGQIIDPTWTGFCINTGGDVSTTTMSYDVVIKGNVCDGFGDSDQITSTPATAGIKMKYTTGLVVSANTVRNSGGFHVVINSVSDLNISDNSFGTLVGTAGVAASGNIAFAGNPADSDTITINGRLFTFKDSPSGNWQIQRDGTTLATTLASAATLLNGNGSKDGRVWLATYTSDATKIYVTYKYPGRSGNYFALAASAATPSGAVLTGGAVGHSGIAIKALTGILSTGIIGKNIFDMGSTFCGAILLNDETSVDWVNNQYTGSGLMYDLKGSGDSPQSGAGNIIGGFFAGAAYDPPSIAGVGNNIFYIPMPGLDYGKAAVSMSTSRAMAGLVISPTVDVTFNAMDVRLDNPSAGAIDLASTTFGIRADRLVASSVSLAP